MGKQIPINPCLKSGKRLNRGEVKKNPWFHALGKNTVSCHCPVPQEKSRGKRTSYEPKERKISDPTISIQYPQKVNPLFLFFYLSITLRFPNLHRRGVLAKTTSLRGGRENVNSALGPATKERKGTKKKKGALKGQ